MKVILFDRDGRQARPAVEIEDTVPPPVIKCDDRFFIHTGRSPKGCEVYREWSPPRPTNGGHS